MKKILKSVTAAVLAACVCVSMSACGNSEEKDLEKKLNALDGMSAEDAEREIEKGLNALDAAGGNSASADEIQTIDPFEDLNVTFSGTAPKSKVAISGGNSLCKYTADKESGVSNGDTVTVTAEFKSEQSNRTLSETTREYTVEGLASYAAKLDDIPAEALDKIRSQSEDIITVKVSASPMEKVDDIGLESYSFEQDSMDFAGYYFLAGKEGFDVSPYNKIYCVYKMRYSVTAYEYDNSLEGSKRETEEHITDYQDFYTFCELNDIILLDDGTCSFDLSSMKITSDTVDVNDKFCNYYGYKLNGFGYYWNGYSDLDSMFSKCVTEKIDKYDYEMTVE